MAKKWELKAGDLLEVVKANPTHHATLGRRGRLAADVSTDDRTHIVHVIWTDDKVPGRVSIGFYVERFQKVSETPSRADWLILEVQHGTEWKAMGRPMTGDHYEQLKQTGKEEMERLNASVRLAFLSVNRVEDIS